MKNRIPLIAFLSLAAASLLVGCGKKESSSQQSQGAAQSADGKTFVAVTANDAMQFSVKEIQAKAGEPLRLTLTNLGKMPKQSMAHNWVLLKPITESELNAFGMAAASKAPDYLPADRSQVLAHTKLLGPGESDTIEFTAPAEAGEYPFICTFPGHYVMMKGKLIVK